MNRSQEVIERFLEQKLGISALKASQMASELADEMLQEGLDQVQLGTDDNGCIVGYAKAYNAYIEQEEAKEAEVMAEALAGCEDDEEDYQNVLFFSLSDFEVKEGFAIAIGFKLPEREDRWKSAATALRAYAASIEANEGWCRPSRSEMPIQIAHGICELR